MARFSDFVPPVIASAARSFRPPPAGPDLYATFGQAERACGPQSYDDDALLRALRIKTERHRDACSAAPPVLWPGESLLLAAIGLAGKPRVHVLDHGGGFGRHYFSLRAALPAALELRWRVAERPGYEREGAGLATDELGVHGSVETAVAALVEPPDVVFTSGTLQCVPNPSGMLHDLCAIGAPHLVIARAGFATGSLPVITVNVTRISAHGWPGPLVDVEDRETRHPLIYVSEQEQLAELAQRYRVACMLDDASGVETALRDRVVGRSLLATRA